MSSSVVEQLPLSICERSLPACRAVRAPRSRLVAHARGTPQRRRLEDFVRREFEAHFGAHVKHFMPLLLALHDAAGNARAVVGCRSAESEELFLETYTRAPIEVALERRLGAGFSWVVLTGADTVKNVFRRLGLAPTVLCTADPELLGPDRNDWGSYYEHHPEVMAGRLRDGQVALRAAAAVQ